LVQEYSLRTTVTIEDELYKQALDVADPDMDKSDLFREAIRVFVRVQSGKRLAAAQDEEDSASPPCLGCPIHGNEDRGRVWRPRHRR
jgi:hypothetical protein